MNSYASISQLLGLSCIGNEAADRRNIESAIDTLLARLAAVEAERDAARAGEARAVEALRRCHEGAARQLAEPRDHDDDQYALTAIATDCEAALADSANALDWIAQQRREAAVEALEGIGAKQTSASGPAAQKVETLIFLADTADKLARLDCELIDRAAMAQRAALFRECAAMMRERKGISWTSEGHGMVLTSAVYRNRLMAIVGRSGRTFFWTVSRVAAREHEEFGTADSLAAAQAAAVAWVDEQEG